MAFNKTIDCFSKNYQSSPKIFNHFIYTCIFSILSISHFILKKLKNPTKRITQISYAKKDALIHFCQQKHFRCESTPLTHNLNAETVFTEFPPERHARCSLIYKIRTPDAFATAPLSFSYLNPISSVLVYCSVNCREIRGQNNVFRFTEIG